MTRRWGFHERLTALIAGVFIIGGAVLLTVQYVLVHQLLTSGVATITAGGASPGAPTPDIFQVDVIDVPGPEDFTGSQEASWELTVLTTSHLSQEVLSALLGWSVVILVLFAGLAVLAARWLSQRSLGRITHITATTRAITRDDLHRRLELPGPVDEIKELGDTIDDMLDRLEEAFTRQEQFVAAASHELRTPLTATRAALEIPLEQGRFEAGVEPAVRRALAANARSESLIAALLTLARTTGDPAPAEGRPVDLTALVQAAVTERAPDAERRGLRTTVTGGTVGAVVDPTLATMLIGNLVENAIRHNLDGGEIRAEVLGDGTGAVLVLGNDGRLLTQAETARLTEPFHRGDRTRIAGPGAGLGLTLAEAITRRLGGVLLLRPREGGGLTVELRLPATTNAV
ncbi:MAG: HAMP domain-containing sensor histidine kinase [Propioniciclava sp.]|uniref:sensor histidine kinase n=1 Tax=Propioniciclava sp. TaxID=2038686 RepID=UPI0039E51429